MAKRLKDKQQTFLSEREKGEKSVNVIFTDLDVPAEMLDDWLGSKTFMKEFDALRERSNFRIEAELVRGACCAATRIANAVTGVGGGFLTRVELQAANNVLRLCHAIVRTPALRRKALAAAKKAAKQIGDADRSLGYHPIHTPERAAALLARLMRKDEKDNKLDRDQDEDGKWVSAD